MDLSEQESSEANLSCRMKYVRPTLDLTCSAPVAPRLTLASVGHPDIGKTLSPVDILRRVSREFRKVSGPEGKVKTEAGGGAERAAVTYPNTELAMRNRLSLYNFADDLLKAVLDKSLKAVNRKWKASWDTQLRRTVRLADEPLYSYAVNFVDELVEECQRRVLSARGHGVARLKAYRTPHRFTVADGLELVLDCIGRWQINPHWCMKVVYAGRNLPADCHSYYYTARLSVPTLSYPVAQVTVDVYFTVDVALMAPPPVHVDVWYRVETDRSRHSALADTFRQEWIDSVVSRKLAAFKTFKF